MRDVSAIVPGMHEEHTVAFCVDTTPGGQSSHMDSPVSLPKVPPAHALQADIPVLGPWYPRAHSEQFCMPSKLLKVPNEQLVQTVSF